MIKIKHTNKGDAHPGRRRPPRPGDVQGHIM